MKFNDSQCAKKMDGKIRVLQLGSPSGLYGAERWILALVKHLDAIKIESYVCVIKDSLDLECLLVREAEALGVNTCVFESYGRANFKAVMLLKSYIKKEKIDILHTHYYKTDLIGLLATMGTNCKIISTPHGWTPKPDLKLYLYEALDRCLFPLMDAVVPLSESMSLHLRFIPGLKKKLHVIKNGVDLSEIDSVDDIHPEIHWLKRQGFLIIGYIGRLVPGKGLDVLLYALANQISLKWKLVIVGEGEDAPLRTLAEKLAISEKVIFFGYQKHRISILKGFDIFVLPSRSEGTPRCLMEAMAAQVPVIATDISGCRNLVTDGENGLLFPVDSVQELTRRINSLAANSLYVGELIKNGRLFIEQNFSAEFMAKRYETLYSKLCG